MKMHFETNFRRSKISVLIISLGELRSATLQSFLGQMKHQIISAVDKKGFQQGSIFANRYPSFNNSKYLSHGEYACVQSHKKALQRFLGGPEQFCLIIEDDAELNFTPTKTSTMLLQQLSVIKDHNTLLHCGGMQGMKFEPYFWLRSRLVNTPLYKLETRFLYRTMAYAVTRKSAETYLQYLSDHPCPVADDWYNFISNTDASIKFKNLFAHPRYDNSSSIASERHGKI